MRTAAAPIASGRQATWSGLRKVLARAVETRLAVSSLLSNDVDLYGTKAKQDYTNPMSGKVNECVV